MKEEDIENWVARFNEAIEQKQEIPWFNQQGLSIGDVIAAKADMENKRVVTTIKLKNGDILTGSIS